MKKDVVEKLAALTTATAAFGLGKLNPE